MTDNTQPESLRLADQLRALSFGGTCILAAAELRRQHARIAELEAQLSSSGFTAADMATASAQGFRDGVASVAASAGSEPVADGWWRKRADEIEAQVAATGSTEAMRCYTDMRTLLQAAAQPSPPEGMVGGWQDIATAPKDGCTLLLGKFNSHGKWRTMRGKWMSENYIAEHWEDPDGVEPGWFETAVEPDDPPNCWPINPTHWMPLPPSPSSADEGGSK